MSVETIVEEPEPQQRAIHFGRPLTNDEMIALNEIISSEEFTVHLAEGERRQSAPSRTAVRYYPRDAAANQEIIATVKAFIAGLPKEAHEPHPEQLLYGADSSLSLQPQ